MTWTLWYFITHSPSITVIKWHYVYSHNETSPETLATLRCIGAVASHFGLTTVIKFGRTCANYVIYHHGQSDPLLSDLVQRTFTTEVGAYNSAGNGHYVQNNRTLFVYVWYLGRWMLYWNGFVWDHVIGHGENGFDTSIFIVVHLTWHPTRHIYFDRGCNYQSYIVSFLNNIKVTLDCYRACMEQ
jgi:hypothetical protein